MSINFQELWVNNSTGTGTFGRVYLAQHKGLFCAIKVLRKTEVVRLKQVEHVLSEKDILFKISHPFIVNLLEHFKDSTNLYMVMEYVVGGEMFSHLRKKGKFNIETTRFYASEILMAISYLHNMDIIYRDLKPENILIDMDGHIKLTDFGFAKKVKDRTWTLCGTPEYLAPEIIQSKGHGKSVDWWAFGILIFEMLAGYPPFFDDNPFGIYEKILNGKIHFPQNFDLISKDLIRKLLVLDRSKRLGNLKNGYIDIMNHPWFNNMNFSYVKDKRFKGPIIPKIKHEGDSSNFDIYDEIDVRQNIDTDDEFAYCFEEF